VKKYDALSEYFLENLQMDSDSPVELLAVLLKLAEICTNENIKHFRKSAVDCGIVQCLISFLKVPIQFMVSEVSLEEKLFPIISVKALECIDTFCQLDSFYHRKFVNPLFLKTLWRFVVPNTGLSIDLVGNFFQFSPTFTQRLKELVMLGHGEVLIKFNADQFISVEDDLSFYEPDLDKILGIQVKSKNAFSVEMAAGQKFDVNVGKKLIDENLASRKCEFVGDEFTSSKTRSQPNTVDLEWKTCQITNILNGNFLWGLIGDKTIKTATLISDTLQELQTSFETIKPEVNDLVVAKVQLKNGSKYFRAQVIDVCRSSVRVFGLDNGLVVNIAADCVYAIPPQLNLSEFRSTVSLIRIKGLAPLPLHMEASKLAATSLNLVCKSNIKYCTVLSELEFFKLTDVVLMPDSDFVSQVLCLAAHLVAKKRLPNIGMNMIYAALIILRKSLKGSEHQLDNSTSTTSPKSNDEKCHQQERRLLVLPSLSFLVNSLFLNKRAKNSFYQAQGLDIVVEIFYRTSDDVLKELAVMVLNNFVHTTKRLDSNGRIMTRTLRNGRFNGLRKSRLIDLIPEPQISPVVKSISLQEDQENVDDNESFDDHSSFSQSSLHHPDKEVSNVQEGILDQTVKSCMLFDSFVTFQADANHEFLQCFSSLRSVQISKLFCGMLNTGQESFVYLGITETGQVKGEVLNHNYRDELRLLVDRVMMSQLDPIVLHLQFSVRYIPVKIDAAQSEGAVERFVVEMKLKPVPKVIYCCRSSGLSYYRFGNSTMLLTPQDVRQMIVIEEEAWLKPQIDELQEQLKALKQELDALDK